MCALERIVVTACCCLTSACVSLCRESRSTWFSVTAGGCSENACRILLGSSFHCFMTSYGWLLMSNLPYSVLERSRTYGRRDVCASEILGVGQSSNVIAISGKHYFHQSNFYFRQHHHFHPEKIYLLRIFCIDPASIFFKEGLFSLKQHTLRKNSLHPIQG